MEEDPRHTTFPPTLWFIGVTDEGRELKVVFIEEDDGTFTLKTAHEPNNLDRITYYAKVRDRSGE